MRGGDEADDEAPRSKRQSSRMERLEDDLALPQHILAASSPAIDIVLPGHTSESEVESGQESDHEAHWHATRPLWAEHATSSDESVISFADIWGVPDEIPSGHGTNSTSARTSRSASPPASPTVSSSEELAALHRPAAGTGLAATIASEAEELPRALPRLHTSEAEQLRAGAPLRLQPRTLCAACFRARYRDASCSAPTAPTEEDTAAGVTSAQSAASAGAHTHAALCAEVHALSAALVGAWSTIEAQLVLALSAAEAANARGCSRCGGKGGSAAPPAAADVAPPVALRVATPRPSTSSALGAESISPAATPRAATRHRARRRTRANR
jgi:hypothetical protein